MTENYDFDCKNCGNLFQHETELESHICKDNHVNTKRRQKTKTLIVNKDRSEERNINNGTVAVNTDTLDETVNITPVAAVNTVTPDVNTVTPAVNTDTLVDDYTSDDNPPDDIDILDMLTETDEIEIVREDDWVANLADYTPLGIVNPNKIIYGLTTTDFIEKSNNTYETIIQWRKNLFKLPTGKAGKDFISELTHWLEIFNTQEDLSSVALKVFMILPALLLQKPSKTSKSKDHSEKLANRLKLWKMGNFEDLIREGQEIQKRLQKSKHSQNKDKAKIFSNLMLKGKVSAALKMLSQEEIGVHEVNDQVVRELQEKHPAPQKIPNETLYEGPINKVLPSYFDEIDESMVLKAITLTKGAGGPSHMDAELYRHLLTSKKFKKENKELRTHIAKLARLLVTKCIDPHSLESYVACRLIPLDKNQVSDQSELEKSSGEL